jgi:hypothetical protein
MFASASLLTLSMMNLIMSCLFRLLKPNQLLVRHMNLSSMSVMACSFSGVASCRGSSILLNFCCCCTARGVAAADRPPVLRRRARRAFSCAPGGSGGLCRLDRLPVRESGIGGSVTESCRSGGASTDGSGAECAMFTTSCSIARCALSGRSWPSPTGSASLLCALMSGPLATSSGSAGLPGRQPAAPAAALPAASPASETTTTMWVSIPGRRSRRGVPRRDSCGGILPYPRATRPTEGGEGAGGVADPPIAAGGMGGPRRGELAVSAVRLPCGHSALLEFRANAALAGWYT